MKERFVSLLLLFAFPILLAQNESTSNDLSAWQDVKVVYDVSEVTNMIKGENMSTTIKTSLNFGTKSKFKRNCLEELKKEAAEKGYSVILINDNASSEKRFNKRGIEITMVGTGYKS